MTVLRVRIEGKVQGVWFRAWTVEQAGILGLDGWVRNLPDGAVEAVFAGAPDRVEAMIALCHRGPPLARVTGVSVSTEAGPIGPGFRQIDERI